MIPERPSVDRRAIGAIDSAPARSAVLVGGCGSGRSSSLLRLRQQIGAGACQYVDVERIATTPERFGQALVTSSPFTWTPPQDTPRTARAAFDRTLGFLASARTADGRPATFLLDEVLELRTFENFPGLRSALRDLIGILPHSTNRFVLTTRYVSRGLRLLRDAGPQFEVIHVPPLGVDEVRAAMAASRRRPVSGDDEDVARAVHALADGRPRYVRTILDAMLAMDQGGGSDPMSALSALLAPGGQLAVLCQFSYELRLHRARGYGALKAILDVLAQEEPLTLTEISHRLHRTPGSTKDYLSWLEDVDLITCRQKRYTFADPLLRLWVRLHCRPAPPTDDELAREIHTYALARLPQQEPAMAMAGAGRAGDDRGKWGIIEID
jgi:hypothetical protein